MAKGKFEVIRIVPSPSNAASLITRFGKKQYGVVTSLSDSHLASLRTLQSENSLVDLKPFGELVRQVHTQLHGRSPRLATTRQVLTAIELACTIPSSLGPFEKVREKAGFHEVVRDVLRMFQHWDCPTDLAKEGTTGEKATALTEIDSHVRQILRDATASSASDLISECLEDQLDLDGQDARVLVFARGEFHPQALRWLQWLASQGADVQLVLDRHAAGGSLFHTSDKTESLLGQKGSAPGEGNRLLNNLFVDSDKGGPDLDLVEIHALGDPFSEAEWAIRRAVNLSGDGEATIYARDRDTYLPVLIAASQRMRVPLRLSRRTPLLANGFIKSVIALLELLGSKDVRDFGRLLRTGYIGPGWSKDVGNLVEQAHLRGGDEWAALAEFLNAEPEPNLLEPTLEYLQEQRAAHDQQTKSPLEWHSYLRGLIEAAPWFQGVVEQAGDDRDQRAFTSLLAALGQDAVVRYASHPNPISFGEWLKVLRQVIDSGDTSVPKLADGINVVCSVDEIGQTDFVIALGLLEGAFPRRRSENPILSDEDLAGFEIEPPLPNSFDTAFAERDHFYRLCASPSKGLILSYPVVDGERDNIPAFYLEEVKRICPNLEEFSHPRRELFPSLEECELEPDRQLAARFQSEPIAPPTNDLVEPKSKEVVRYEKTPIRPRDLLAMRDCTFRFLASRTLPIPWEQSDYWRRLLRVPDTAHLLTCPTEVDAALALKAAFEHTLDEIRPFLPGWEVDLIEQGSERVFQGLIEREFASREQWRRNVENTKIGGYLEDFSSSKVYRERLAGVTEQNSIRTLHLYRTSAPEKLLNSNREDLLLEYGSMICDAWNGVHEVEVEIESLGDRRTKLIFVPEDAPHPRSSDALAVINLGFGDATRDDLRHALKKIYETGLSKARSGQMPTNPGDYCARCQVSDLCRRSQTASEEVDLFLEEGDERS